MFESFRKPKLTTEQQATKRAFDEADPTKYSALPPEGKLRSEWKLINRQNKTVTDQDSRYFEVTKSPQLQQALARMGKGILNVSDIVSVTDQKLKKHYYSREVPLEKIKEETPREEISADLFILDVVFSNPDRLYSDSEINNVRTGNERAAYFDFQGGLIIEDRFMSWDEKIEELEPDTINIALRKLFALRERFEGEGGLGFLGTIVKASGRTAWNLFAPHNRKYTVADLQKSLLFQIDIALEKLTARQKKDREAATIDLPR